MSGTRPRNRRVTDSTMKTSNVKSTATQTPKLDSFVEIAKLQEQLKLLQLENNILRQHMQVPPKIDGATRHKLFSLEVQEIPKNISKKYCNCKGNCSSKICGCVKKNNRCTLSCKCNEACKNQKLEESPEDKENYNEINVHVKATEKQVKDTKDTIHETNSNNVINSDAKSDNIVAQFDPMKPRHQLSRTPPNMRKVDEIINKSVNNQSDNTIVTLLHYESPQEKKISPLNNKKKLEEAEVNWEEHTAQLIPCKKCNRKFMPHRIQKHEACCKKI